ncbi:uncharacterized protein LY79DRAFT_78983 [Colletotrichum navitas]|uniref:Uncharacterized protein n=1 Tax=Colletotrichum navitas TaxID=681940 RepID=A0AAD8V942_9PEZI|nr:uncharacterized protein LY79DRAFT_78983 [Colletotrichum navitas]KAK1596090.1 hypothetical protein LY79DRAFT_78983 [Colletotrichum navitas]
MMPWERGPGPDRVSVRGSGGSPGLCESLQPRLDQTMKQERGKILLLTFFPQIFYIPYPNSGKLQPVVSPAQRIAPLSRVSADFINIAFTEFPDTRAISGVRDGIMQASSQGSGRGECTPASMTLSNYGGLPSDPGRLSTISPMPSWAYLQSDIGRFFG